MSLIEPNLYLGSLDEACSRRWLEEHKVTHVLTIEDDPLKESELRKHMFIQAMDIESTDLLSHFDRTFDFLYECHSSEGGVALVHCLMGISRSTTVVTAYLMRKYRISHEEALARVQKRRPMASPNVGFRKQLQLYHHLEYRIDLDHALYREYAILMKRGTLFGHARQLEIDKLMKKALDGIAENAPSDGEYWVFKCRLCRTVLFDSTHLIGHVIGKHRDALEDAAAGQPDKDAIMCPEGCYVLPVRWMQDAVTDVASGKLHCPTAKCAAKLGTFNWAGMECACGAWITPAFHIQNVKVDRETKKKTPGGEMEPESKSATSD